MLPIERLGATFSDDSENEDKSLDGEPAEKLLRELKLIEETLKLDRLKFVEGSDIEVDSIENGIEGSDRDSDGSDRDVEGIESDVEGSDNEVDGSDR